MFKKFLLFFLGPLKDVGGAMVTAYRALKLTNTVYDTAQKIQDTHTLQKVSGTALTAGSADKWKASFAEEMQKAKKDGFDPQVAANNAWYMYMVAFVGGAIQLLIGFMTMRLGPVVSGLILLLLAVMVFGFPVFQFRKRAFTPYRIYLLNLKKYKLHALYQAKPRMD